LASCHHRRAVSTLTTTTIDHNRRQFVYVQMPQGLPRNSCARCAQLPCMWTSRKTCAHSRTLRDQPRERISPCHCASTSSTVSIRDPTSHAQAVFRPTQLAGRLQRWGSSRRQRAHRRPPGAIARWNAEPIRLASNGEPPRRRRPVATAGHRPGNSANGQTHSACAGRRSPGSRDVPPDAAGRRLGDGGGPPADGGACCGHQDGSPAGSAGDRQSHIHDLRPHVRASDIARPDGQVQPADECGFRRRNRSRAKDCCRSETQGVRRSAAGLVGVCTNGAPPTGG